MLTIFLLLSSLSLSSFALPKCPLLGPNFPAARNLATSSSISGASSNLTQLIEAAISSGSLTNATSFSFQVFSTEDDNTLFSHYYSAPALANNPSGVKKVDGDTIYRVGSLSKLFTVYLFLLEASDVRFDDPITKYVPELQALSKQKRDPSNAIDYVDWADVTVGELASQMSGIGREYGFGEVYLLNSAPDYSKVTALGLPPLNNSETPLCGISFSNLDCSRSEFFKGFGQRHPIFAPSYAPVYSNVAYQILAYALESITGKQFSTMMEKDVFEKLRMSNSFYHLPPDDSKAIIPLSPAASYWNIDIGDEIPGGGLYSTASDVTKFGHAILKSTQLSPALTRRWMKPRAFTSDNTFSVGAPWEIRRTQQNLNMIDIYTKSGDVGAYSGLLVLVPQYNVGFSILAASGDKTADAAVTKVSNLFGETFLPALEDAAREEAAVNFAGRYSSSNLQSLNTSVVIEANADAGPGLTVSSFVSNGTDVLATLVGPGRSLTLYPSGLLDPSSGRVSFRGVFNRADSIPVDTGVFSTDCTSWATIETSHQYGGISVDEFTFVVGKDGKAVSIQPRVMRVSLDRSS